MANQIKYTIEAAREQAGITLENMAYYLHVKKERYTEFEKYEAYMTSFQAYHFRNLVRIPFDNILLCSPSDTLEIRNKMGYTDLLHIVYGTNEKNPIAGNGEVLVRIGNTVRTIAN